MISANSIIGSLVYRTRVELNNNKPFIDQMQSYLYAPNCFIGDQFSFWHYPGNQNEISNTILKMGQLPDGGLFKYPSLFNFQPIRQEFKGMNRTATFNLAFVAPVQLEWTTSQRENNVFEPLLRPIYNEFFNQIEKSKYFNLDFGFIPHDYYEVYTTGESGGHLLDRYGDHIDAIEVHGLRLMVRNLCQQDIKQIENENKLVTEILWKDK